MTLYDSSVLIEYLDDADEVVSYVDEHSTERSVAPPLVLFEVYQGEVFKSGRADFDAVDDALAWLTIVDASVGVARAAAELQDELRHTGDPLAARDAFIAGAAKAHDETLVVADGDFDVEGLTDVLDVDLLSV